MARILTFVSLIIFSTQIFADANDGDYLGFTLGDRFEIPRGADGQHHITGAMIYDVDPGRQAHHMDSMSIYVSPKSATIGSIFGEWYFSNKRSATNFANQYLSSLEQKYGHWQRKGRSLTYGDYQLWVDIEEKSPYSEYWPSRKKSRVAIALIFAPESEGRYEWMAQIKWEINNHEAIPEKVASQR